MSTESDMVKMMVDELRARVMRLESQIIDLSETPTVDESSPALPPPFFIPDQIDADFSMASVNSRSIQRATSSDEFSIYGIQSPRIVQPVADDFKVATRKYLAAIRSTDTDVGGVPTVVWGDLSNLSGNDVYVKCTANDTTPGFLHAKLYPGSYIGIGTINAGGNEQEQISVDYASLSSYLQSNLSFAPLAGQPWNHITDADDLNAMYGGWFVRENMAGNGIEFYDPSTLPFINSSLYGIKKASQLTPDDYVLVKL